MLDSCPLKPKKMPITTHKSACILCSVNCGINIEVDHETKQFVKITGDKDHPTSQGYICQKATRLNYYQQQERLTSPLRKKADGAFEEISWDTAIQEIADKLVKLRDTHGGHSIAYAGGGGQGNHLAQMYASTFRKVLGTPYIYSSIAQEKTGNFWVNGKLFGRQNVNYGEPIADAEFGMIIGANPMQSHGMARARRVIGGIARDKNRTLVVIDPRLNETAKKADYFLQVKPGRDAWLMSAMLGIIVQEDLVDTEFIAEHTNGFAEVKPYFMTIPIKEYCEIAGVDDELVREAFDSSDTDWLEQARYQREKKFGEEIPEDFKERARQFGHQFRHGRREQHRLALFWQQRYDFTQGMDEPHVEHLVGFIQHQINRFVQTHGPTVDQVDQTPRCCNEQVNTASKAFGLGGNARTTNHKRHFQVAAFGIGGQVFRNLLGQFTCRRKDQTARRFWARLYAGLKQCVDHRQAKGRRFPRTGLGKPHHIAAIHGMRDGLGLNWGGIGDPLFFQNGNETGREAQHIKIHKYLSCGQRPAHNGQPAANCEQACAGCAHMLTAKATCPDADQALDPLRDVGTGSKRCLAQTDCLALLTRQDASVKGANGASWFESQGRAG